MLSVVAILYEWSSWVLFLELGGEIHGGADDIVGGRGAWHGCLRGKEFDCVKDASGLGEGHVELVAAVMLHCRSDVPTCGAVRGPRAALVGFVVADGKHAGRGKRSLVVIKGAVELRVGGEARIDARRS